MCDLIKCSRLISPMIGLVLVVISASSECSYAQPPDIEPKADQILRIMSNYLGGLNQFSAQTENSLDVVFNTGEKIQYNNPANFSIQRPNKLRAERRGDLIDQEFYYDGHSLTLFQKDRNCYATVQAPATLEDMLDFARYSLDVYAPAGDLLHKNSYNILTEDVISGFYVGLGVVDGVKCHHLAFRGNEVDWQIWIEDGDKPLPKRFVITSKWITGAPQYTVTLKNWNLSPRLTDDFFNFTPSKDMEQIDFIGLESDAPTLR